jgi:DNA transposition AAA+ family ATPase
MPLTTQGTLTIIPSDHPLKHQLNLLLSGQFIPEGQTQPVLDENGLAPAQAAVARAIGINASVLSNYKSERGYEGNVAKLEGKISDMFKQLNSGSLTFDRSQEKIQTADFFETPVVRRVRNTLNDIKRNRFLGAIESVPGLGKTEAVREFIRNDKLGVLITLSLARHGGHPHGIQQAFIDAPNVESQSCKQHARGPWLCKKFGDSDRLIIIDNAETLTVSGLDWVLSFYDETRCPMALVGNNELHKTLSRLERAVGRIYPYVRIDFGKDDSKKATEYYECCARHYLGRQWPDALKDPEALKLAKEVVIGSGHLRSLHKVVKQALAWTSERPDDFESPSDAIKASLDRHATHRRKG